MRRQWARVNPGNYNESNGASTRKITNAHRKIALVFLILIEIFAIGTHLTVNLHKYSHFTKNYYRKVNNFLLTHIPLSRF